MTKAELPCFHEKIDDQWAGLEANHGFSLYFHKGEIHSSVWPPVVLKIGGARFNVAEWYWASFSHYNETQFYYKQELRIRGWLLRAWKDEKTYWEVGVEKIDTTKIRKLKLRKGNSCCQRHK